MNLSLTYDDISVVPREKSTIESRTIPDPSIRVNGYPLAAPIIISPMDTVCNKEMAEALLNHGLVGITHRFQSIEEQKRNTLMGFAVGVSGDYQKRLESLVETGASWICFDTANGFTSQMEKAFTWYKENLYTPSHITIAGNVASKEGYEFLDDLGVDIVRVGIGSGSPCTTSMVTGCGAGMVSVIRECYQADRAALILADGGIRSSGDIVKALAVGADLVMCGSLFAGFAESPGKVVNGHKVFRGMASLGASQTIGKIGTPEGVEHKIPFKGSVYGFIPDLIGGLKIAMSYLNSRNLDEFHNYFLKHDAIVQLTSASFHERKPHIL